MHIPAFRLRSVSFKYLALEFIQGRYSVCMFVQFDDLQRSSVKISPKLNNFPDVSKRLSMQNLCYLTC